MKKNIFFYNEEGYILVSAFIVILVILILGTAYANLSISQFRQAELHNDRKQAYYYARSGSEKAFIRITEGLKNSEYSYFEDFSWDLNTDEIANPDSEAKVNVNITLYPENIDIENFKITDINKIKVNSTGIEGKIKVNKSANFTLTYIGLNMDDSTDNVNFSDLLSNADEIENWTSGSSAVINSGEYEVDYSVEFSADGNDLKYNSNNGYAKFKANEFNFYTDKTNASLSLMNDSQLTLVSDTIKFDTSVELDNDFLLCFMTDNVNGGKVEFVDGVQIKKGELIIDPGVYTFPGNTEEPICIPGSRSNLTNWTIKWE